MGWPRLPSEDDSTEVWAAGTEDPEDVASGPAELGTPVGANSHSVLEGRAAGDAACWFEVDVESLEAELGIALARTESELGLSCEL